MRAFHVILLLAFPSVLRAQLVQGRVLEAGSDHPIRVAGLALLDDRDRVLAEGVADSTGAFRIRGWQAGKYQLRATALGYRTVLSAVFELGSGETFEVAVRLARDAIPLDPITVVSRSRSSLIELALRGYYDRRDVGRRMGTGRFIDRGEIERNGAANITLRAGVWSRNVTSDSISMAW
jgi:hypothetical protein